MNDIRRTILWVIFGFSMVLLWDQWQIYNGHKATFFQGQPVKTEAAAPAGAKTTASDASVPGSVPVAQASLPGAVPAAAEGATVAPSGERFTVHSDVLNLHFDTQGGTLVGSEFLKYGDISDHSKPVTLLDDSKNRTYLAQSGVVSGAVPGNFPTHRTLMVVTGERELKDGSNSLQIRFESPDVGGIKLVKTYTIKRGSYAMAVSHALTNTTGTPLAPQLYLQLTRNGAPPEGESSFYSTFTGPAVYTEAKKYQKVQFADIKKNNADFEKQSTNGYVAMVQHYFASAWLLPEGQARNISLKYEPSTGGGVTDCCYHAAIVAPLEAIAPGGTRTVETTLFVGPQEEKMLEALAPGLELVKDYGWLTILAKPLYFLLDFLHSLIQNWGWSIVALVLLLKIAFYWLNAKAYSSMAKMKAVNPKITEMRERLKDNPQQMQQEMMRIYREEKVNPMGGCFPIMIQIPVFIALYWVLLSSVEMRGAPWILWITDLSAPDSSLGHILSMPVGVLPIVMLLTTLLQTSLNPAPPDPMQAKMMWFMPLAFSFMFFFFPAGLVLYWITNNILSIAQQWLINTRMGVPPQFNLPSFK